MSTIDELVPILRYFRMPGLLMNLELRIRQAVEDNLGHEEFLYRLFHDEYERRQANLLEMRLRKADFEEEKTLEDYNFHFNPEQPKAKLIDLGTCNFFIKHENVILIGKAGVGKSHIAQALGNRVCRLGHNVLFISANKLFGQLRAERADGTYDRLLSRLAKVPLLIIDDLGLHPLRDDEPIDLYEIIRLRYQRASIIITTNRDIEEWYPLFSDALLASAAMDRLLHYSKIIIMEGDSYRNPPKEKANKK